MKVNAKQMYAVSASLPYEVRLNPAGTRMKAANSAHAPNFFTRLAFIRICLRPS